MKKTLFSIIPLFILLIACSTNPITGRKQVQLLPESTLIGQSKLAYTNVLTENSEKVLPLTHPQAKRVNDIGVKISKEVESYLTELGAQDRFAGFEWEFKTIDEDIVNAWCMPGGKVVFYTGILKLMSSDDEIAAVMGHEIAHAIARHGNERMSQTYGAQIATAPFAVYAETNPTAANQILLQAVGIGSQLGVLSFSRKQELESDHMGVIFMDKAGYNPYAALDFWKKMKAQGGPKPPEFMSTHPSDDRRIKQIEKILMKMHLDED